MPNFTFIISAIQDLCSPSEHNVPPNISKTAIPIWNHIVTRYADEIYHNGRNVDKQWIKAKSLFESSCKAQNIDPYTN